MNVTRIDDARNRPRVEDRSASDRTPPQDRMAEAAVLEAVLIEGATALDAISEKLQPEHFFVEAYRRIYEAACAVRKAGTDVDVVTVAGRLRDSGRLAQIGGFATLAELRDSTPSTSHVSAHARIVRDKARIRSLISRCTRLAAEGYGESDATEYAAQVRGDLDEILRDSSEDGGRMIGHDIDAIYQRLAGRGTGVGRGIPSGFAELDDFTTGLHAGDVTYIAGRPGMGKTSFALCIARNMAYMGWYDDPPVALQNVVAFYSIEQPRDQILMRLACIDGGIDNQRLRKQELTDIEWRDLCSACGRMKGLPIYLDDKPLDLARLRSSLLKLRSEAKASGKRLVAAFIDYLQLMKGDGKDENERISKNSAGLKELAKELEIPIVALCQLNRDVEKQQDKRPGLSDLRGSGSLEQDADNVIFLYRDDYYRDRHLDSDGDAELIVAKQRNGPSPCTATVKFYAGCTRFENA